MVIPLDVRVVIFFVNMHPMFLNPKIQSSGEVSLNRENALIVWGTGLCTHCVVWGLHGLSEMQVGYYEGIYRYLRVVFTTVYTELTSHMRQSCDLSAPHTGLTLQLALLPLGTASFRRLGSPRVYNWTKRISLWLVRGEDPGTQMRADRRNGLEVNKENVCREGGMGYTVVGLLPSRDGMIGAKVGSMCVFLLHGGGDSGKWSFQRGWQPIVLFLYGHLGTTDLFYRWERHDWMNLLTKVVQIAVWGRWSGGSKPKAAVAQSGCGCVAVGKLGRALRSRLELRLPWP